MAEENISNLHSNEKRNELHQRKSQEDIRSSNEIYSCRQEIGNRLAERIGENEKELERQLSKHEKDDLERQVAYDYAKEKNVWIEDLYSLGEPSGIGGNENTIAIDKKRQIIFKSNNLVNCQNSIINLFDGINAHNEIFPHSKYEFVGFTGFKHGKIPYIEPIFKQHYVHDAEKATQFEIDYYMDSIGFEKVNDHTFRNGKYIVSDLRPRNVLRDAENNIHVIDDIIKKDTENYKLNHEDIREAWMLLNDNSISGIQWLQVQAEKYPTKTINVYEIYPKFVVEGFLNNPSGVHGSAKQILDDLNNGIEISKKPIIQKNILLTGQTNGFCKYIVADGYHRIQALLAKGIIEIEVKELPIDIQSKYPANEFNIKNEIKKALDEGKYQKAILEGRMTAKDAKRIIESAMIEVPEDISNLVEQSPLHTKLKFSKGGEVDFTAKGGNQVVDYKGDPITLYHGTNKNFSDFDVTKGEVGIHVGTQDQAISFKNKDGGRVIKLQVSIKNPIRLPDIGQWDAPYVIGYLRDANILPKSEDIFSDELLDMTKEEGDAYIREELKKAGYDGIVYLNRREGIPKKEAQLVEENGYVELEGSDDEFKKIAPSAKDSYIVFDKSQIKVLESLLYKEQPKAEVKDKVVGGDVGRDFNDDEYNDISKQLDEFSKPFSGDKKIKINFRGEDVEISTHRENEDNKYEEIYFTIKSGKHETESPSIEVRKVKDGEDVVNLIDSRLRKIISDKVNEVRDIPLHEVNNTFKKYLDDNNIEYTITQASTGTKYYNIDGNKIRVSDHDKISGNEPKYTTKSITASEKGDDSNFHINSGKYKKGELETKISKIVEQSLLSKEQTNEPVTTSDQNYSSFEPKKVVGITEVSVSEDGKELKYGVKNNRTVLSVIGLSQKEIAEELEFEKRFLKDAEKRLADPENTEVAIRMSRGMTGEEKLDAIRQIKRDKQSVEIKKNITIPFLESHIVNEPTTTEANKPVSENVSQSKRQGDKEGISEGTNGIGQGRTERTIPILDELGFNNIKQDVNEAVNRLIDKLKNESLKITTKTTKNGIFVYSDKYETFFSYEERPSEEQLNIEELEFIRLNVNKKQQMAKSNELTQLDENEVEYMMSEPVFQDEKANKKAFINDNWYEMHPEKILGEAYEASGRFGTVTKYKGTIEVLSLIEVDESFIGANKALNDPLASVSYDMNLSGEILKPDVKDFVTEVIEKSFNEINSIKKSKKAKEKEKENKTDSVASTPEILSFEQVFKNLNPKISLETVEVYTWYKSSINRPLSKNYVALFNKDLFDKSEDLRESYKYTVDESKVAEWVKKGMLFYSDGILIPELEYTSGNMYERKLQLANDKDIIIEKYGQDIFDKQEVVLTNAYLEVYNKRSVIGGENSLVLLANSSFSSEFMIESISDLDSDEKFYIKSVTDSNKSDYGKPDLLKDILPNAKKTHFDEISLKYAFGWWLLNKTPLLKEAISHLEIVKYYVLSKNIIIPHDKNDLVAVKKANAEKEKLNASTQKEGERLFMDFLETQLLPNDKIRLETQWNKTYKNYLPIDLLKVPVAFTMAKYVNGQEEDVRPEKRDAVAFTMNNGTAVLSYDVGVGKTPSAIFTISAFLDAGYCKRPLIVVPNQVYKQFISDIRAFTPHIPVIEAYNLSEEYLENFKDASGKVKEAELGSITVMTYEGFENVGFNEDTTNLLIGDLYEILNQGTTEAEEKKKKAKGEASLIQRIETIVGRGLRGTMINVEDLKFDFICYDEAHKMKKVFTNVKGEAIVNEKGVVEGREKNPYEISSGTASSIALKGFMINHYILKENNFQNILLMTATPFTNSPLEIFSMLSMVAYEQLKKTSMSNIKSFFDTYVKSSNELVINTKLKPQFKQVILGFNNLLSLQSLIRRYILYKTGEEVGVIRPKKYVLPYLKEIENDVVIDVPESRKVETYLPMTSLQKSIMEDIVSYVENGSDLGAGDSENEGDVDTIKDEDEGIDTSSKGIDIDEDSLSEPEKRGVRTIKGLNYSRNLALSPFLYEFSGLGKPDYKSYIETSPKLFYVMQCVKSVMDYHKSNNEPISGQVIYMDRGVKYFNLIKQYLIEEIGYKPHEVGLIVSGLPKTGKRSKEYVKNLFNGEVYNENTKSFDDVSDEERIKVVIGSSTIKEGMNLQKYGTVLYNCFIDWNPTDIKQLEGRIYRQKNTFAAVRIVNPLMVDSSDIFMFQKLQEKTSRLNDIWSTDGKTNALDTAELNTEELKYALIRDPNVIAELKMIEEKAILTSEKLAYTRQLEIIKRVSSAANTINKYFKDQLDQLEDYRDFSLTGDKLADATRLVAVTNDLYKKQTDKEGRKIYYSWQLNSLEKEEIEKASPLKYKFDKEYRFSDFAIAVRDLSRYMITFINQYKIDFDINHHEDSLKVYKNKIEAQIEIVEKREAQIDTPENIRQLVEDAIEEKERQKISYKSLPEVIKDFSKLNYLLSEKKVKKGVKVSKYTTCPPKEEDGTFAITDEAIQELKKCLSKLPQTKELYFSAKTGYTEDRKKVHEKIINDLFENVKCVKSGEQPIAIFTGGSPASGKSSFIKKKADYLQNKDIFHLDADEIRSKLPEYEGWNADATHTETQDIVNGILEKIGSEECRYDLIYDGTMNKAKKYFDLINKVRALGYKIYIIFMEIPYAEAITRALLRYKRSGRFVPLEVIDDFFSATTDGKSKGQSALDQLKPLVDGYVVADGITSEIIEVGGEGLPKGRKKSVYTEPLLSKKKEPETVVEELETVVEEPQDVASMKDEAIATIAALKYIAAKGNQEAIDTINSLKFLI